MKLWVDHVRPAPEGYVWCRYVEEVIAFIEAREKRIKKLNSEGVLSEERRKELTIELIDFYYNSECRAQYEEDYTKFFNWLEKTGRYYPLRINGMNPV